MVEVRIGPRDGDSSPVLLRVGDVLTVEVPENRTTGYVWSVVAVPAQLAELPPDEGVDADADADADARAAPGPPLQGASGLRTLRFTAQQPGAGELLLRHGRPWQPTEGEDRVVAVRVEPAE